MSCSGKASWQSLTYHVTSSVREEGCHFSLTREGDGMLLSGYCFDGGTEYCQDEPKQIRKETQEVIAAMDPDHARTAGRRLFHMADGKQTAVTLSSADGSQRKISLSAAEKEKLKQLLQKELMGK